MNGDTVNAASSPVVVYETIHEFPNIGIGNRLYIDRSKNMCYRWEPSEMHYVIVGSSIHDIKVINGGNSNG